MPKWIKELHDAEWLRLVYETKSAKQISDLLGCSPSGVIQALRRHGIKARPVGRKSAPDCLRDPKWLAEQYEAFTSHQIAASIGCSQNAVMDALYKCGIPVRGRGLRRRKMAYKQIMTSNGRSMQQHRRIMEQHLGRKLRSNEHVHHINGIKDDNRLQNLIVLSASDHHKLHAMTYDRTCQKCGASFKGANRRMTCDSCRVGH